MRGKIIFSFIFTILLTGVAYAGTYGVVTGDRVNVRANAEMNDENRLFQVNRGTPVEIHGVAGDFFHSNVLGEYYVYISRDFVRFSQTTGTVTASFAWVYDLPGQAGGTALTMLSYGENVIVTSAYKNWYGIKLDGASAFVEQANVEVPCFVELPTARIGKTLADIIVEKSMNYIGTGYLWGGTTPNGFDCSGFMVYLFSAHGIHLNRRSSDQARNGTAVARNELERGDLIFFGSGNHISHVGMYIGYGEFIHSSSTASGGVIVSSLSNSSNSGRFITARRVLA
ncbi:MAG: C40 family peptidase [Defluviitaleaceae bacterium]|nr:C40 family peptidase [Defluviitaleaceae bacterium]